MKQAKSDQNLNGLTASQCQAARKSRDARFDGRFFVAVKTTGIFCRPICPAVSPKEANVSYYPNNFSAIKDGYRPCLRCRPESAPDSWAWRGVESTFQRGLKLIEEGALQESSLEILSQRLGVSSRYFRRLFGRYLGMPPKHYSLLKQLMFAKQLLHSSSLSVSDIAFASGFQSIRRFNDAFKKELQLTPGLVRKKLASTEPGIHLSFAFRPPFNWDYLLAFYAERQIRGLESVSESSYCRTFHFLKAKGWMEAKLNPSGNTLDVYLELNSLSVLWQLANRIRRNFDLDADPFAIENHLEGVGPPFPVERGIRIPGAWDPFEAGVRAILGQQVSLKAATTLTAQLVTVLGEPFKTTKDSSVCVLFPTPEIISKANLDFLPIPQSRRNTLSRFAQFNLPNLKDPLEWLQIKGIGPWTLDYARLRGQSDPDVLLATDLVIQKSLKDLEIGPKTKRFSPWGSYATLHLWKYQQKETSK